jgi:hypothetical protein
MKGKPYAQELIRVGNAVSIELDVWDENEAKPFIKRVINIYKPFKITGHLAIGGESLIIPLEGNEYSYSSRLSSEPAYIFFDQESRDRHTVVAVKDAKSVGELMKNSYGMEYFVTNETSSYLIAVNWYGIEIVGSAVENLKYNIWAEKRVEELIHSKVKKGNCYDEELMREYLIFAQHSRGEALKEFFVQNNNDNDLFKIILGILLDESEDYSNDARYSAAGMIPLFHLSVLKKYKKELRYAQEYKILHLRPFSDNDIPSWLYEDSSSQV